MNRKLLAKARKSKNKFWQANPKKKVDHEKLNLFLRHVCIAALEKSWKECKSEPAPKYLLVGAKLAKRIVSGFLKKKRQRKGGKNG